jgi:hypothetical protein
MTNSTPLPPHEELLEQRRIAVSNNSHITGLNYVTYLPPTLLQQSSQLALYFVDKAAGVSGDSIPAGMTLSNIEIRLKKQGTGNTSFVIKPFKVPDPPPPGDIWLLEIDPKTEINPQDNTVYTLSLIGLNNVDIFLSQADFAICTNAQAAFDPLQSAPSAKVSLPPVPDIDYLSRDYLSFRQLMLNRLSVLIPDWQADNPADLGSVIIDILAYAADYMSYYQDAVATEAYLETARLRVSVKRHTRLMDYTLSEGCNARVWVHVQVKQSVQLPSQTILLTRGSLLPGVFLANSDSYQTLMNEGVVVFATLYTSKLYPQHNLINFYTWGSQKLSLPIGAIRATLEGDLSNLQVGDVLTFEQVKGAITGLPEDAKVIQRCVVCLTQVKQTSDPLYNTKVTEITWSEEDALPFAFVISNIVNGVPVTGISQARGNMILADQGQFIDGEPLYPPIVPKQGIYRPRLAQLNLTFSESFDLDVNLNYQSGASRATLQDPRRAKPSIFLKQGDSTWEVKSDLLHSNYLSTNFVVEIEENRETFLRFGDGIFGKLPSADSKFSAHYRTGNGSSGNIGADTLAYIVVDASLATSITQVTNPLPAQGGADPEPTALAKLYAPQAFQQQRCVTVADYIKTTNQFPGVKRAGAVLSWTGSWETVFIATDLNSTVIFTNEFKQRLLNYLGQYQLLHHDLEIIPPRWVALDIVLPVRVKPGCIPNVVEQSLIKRFSSQILPDGSRGFFHPDNFTFGQAVYLSDIVLAVMETPGIAVVDIRSPKVRFRRMNYTLNAIEAEKITMSPLEIAQVLNNPDVPQTGLIQFPMEVSDE